MDGVGVGDMVVRKELSVERSTLAIEAALKGVGVILESDFLAAEEMGDGLLVEPFGDRYRSPPEDAYFLATRKREPGRKPVDAFVEWLMAEAGKI
jgi:LysR family glycine cleavage system transcriptional activator